MKKFALTCIYLSLFFPGFTADKWKDASAHTVSFVTVAPEVKLEVLDWGGTGEALLFLSGLGHTAHVFDEFAPQFTDKYHVLGLTRRGFGASSQPGSGYDLTTLTSDIIAIIDSLQIEKIILIGHSVAGEEMTKFAALYPDRTNKLIYLDAAYDRTNIMSLFENAPQPPSMTAHDSSTVWTIQSFNQKTFGMLVSETEYRSACIFSDDGNYIGEITADSTIGMLMAGIEKPAYASVKAPALAFYAIPGSLYDVMPYYEQLNDTAKIAAAGLFEIMQEESRHQAEVFEKEVIAGKAIQLQGAHHYVFLSHPEMVALEIRKFLAE